MNSQFVLIQHILHNPDLVNDAIKSGINMQSFSDNNSNYTNLSKVFQICQQRYDRFKARPSDDELALFDIKLEPKSNLDIGFNQVLTEVLNQSKKKKIAAAIEAAANSLCVDNPDLDKLILELTSNIKNVKPKEDLKIVMGNEIKTQPTEWLLAPYIALGEATLLAGEEGKGKSLFLTKLAALISTGQINSILDNPAKSPTCHNVTGGKNAKSGMLPATTLYYNIEDSPERTIIPRAEANGADVSRIGLISSDVKSFNFGNVAAVEEHIKERNPILIIFDNVSSFLGGKTDINSQNQVVEQLKPYSALAKKYNIAIIFVAHWNKNSKGNIHDRVMGSKGFMTLVRSVLHIIPDVENTSDFFLYQSKSNLGKMGDVLRFQIEEVSDGYGGKGTLPKLNFVCSENRDIVNQEPIKKHNDIVKPRELAIEFLKSKLENGPVPASELATEADVLKIAKRTLDRAKTELEVRTFHEDKQWYWELAKLN